MKTKAVACVAGVIACALLLPTGAFAKDGKRNANVTVKNTSDWSLHHFFLSPSEEDEWGPDQLGDEVIKTGGSFTLTSIPCDKYDVKLVDEDGDECVVEAVDLCASHDQWVVDNDDLLACENDDDGD
jgi:hypothetical protein